jgi:hypothetical protein
MTFKIWFDKKFNPQKEEDYILYKYEFDLIYLSYVSDCKKQGVMYQKEQEAWK